MIINHLYKIYKRSYQQADQKAEATIQGPSNPKY